MSHEYPWYELLSLENTSLQQGDLIPDCPVILPPQNLKPNHEYEFEVVTYNTIVMSQSCDLENDKLEIVLVCTYFTWAEFVNQLPNDQQSKKNINKIFDRFRQGLQPNYHLLNKSEDKQIEDYLIVDFRTVYGVHINFLKEYICSLQTQRVRLLPPYREHLAQAFARFFMRVGLPQDIQPFL